jgi:glutaredoxin
MNVVIYGKKQCPFCDKAKMVCEQRGFDYEYYEMDKDFTLEFIQFKFPSAKTFPQIIVDGTHVGGYTDMMELIDG